MNFPYTNVQEYLHATGVLENGTPEAIAQARKLFRKLYLKNYRKKYAQDHSNVSLTFTREDKALLAEIALQQGKKLASYIKQQVLQGVHSVPDPHVAYNIQEMKGLLSLCLDIVEELQFENDYPLLQGSFHELETLFNSMCRLLEHDY